LRLARNSCRKQRPAENVVCRLFGFARFSKTTRWYGPPQGWTARRSVPTISEMVSRDMRIVFIGTGEIGVPTLRALLDSGHEIASVATHPEKPAGREQRIEPPPLKKALSGNARSLAFAEAMAGKPGPPIFQPARIKNPEAVENIRRLTPDVIVVVAYGQIL